MLQEDKIFKYYYSLVNIISDFAYGCLTVFVSCKIDKCEIASEVFIVTWY